MRNGDELQRLTDLAEMMQRFGLTRREVAELTTRSLGTIDRYLCGKLPVPRWLLRLLELQLWASKARPQIREQIDIEKHLS